RERQADARMVRPLANIEQALAAAGPGGNDVREGGELMESRAVAFVRAHLEAWSNHDLETARGNLAADVKFYSPAANLVGIDEYMYRPRRLTQFAAQVVPGSLRVLAAVGDDRDALVMYDVDPEGGAIGLRTCRPAQT